MYKVLTGYNEPLYDVSQSECDSHDDC